MKRLVSGILVLLIFAMASSGQQRNNIDDIYDRVEKLAFTGGEPLRLRS